MDVIFNCPKCEQELAVDSAGAGSEINCPSCGETIVIPEPESVVPRPGVENEPGVPRIEPRTVNPMASSAAAKVEMHFRVASNKTTESLISKPLIPLDAAAKETEKTIRVKTIRHIDCVEVGHDKFDEIVTKFLVKIGESNVVNINTLSYSFLDIGTQKLLTDYGLLIVYRG
jgi:DNA-directed RNA polymerase subunit RPC12/RpoP